MKCPLQITDPRKEWAPATSNFMVALSVHIAFDSRYRDHISAVLDAEVKGLIVKTA